MHLKKLTASSRYKEDHKPPDIEHGGMVEHMEECNLGILLPKNHENRINEFNNFGEEIPPHDCSNLK